MRLLKVQGAGRIAESPDTVTISFYVAAKSWEYEDTLKDLNNRTENLRQNISEAGISRTELKTTHFSVSIDTKYEDDEEEESKFNGYDASHHLQIELPLDKDDLNRILRQVAQGYSGTEIQLSFSVKDSEALRQRVLAEAVRAARANAAVIAEAADISLGSLQQVDYGWAEVRFNTQQYNYLNESISLAVAEPDIEPEDVMASDSVTLVYEIQD